jgi:hypothetical protein
MPKRLFDWRKRHRGHEVVRSEAAPLENGASQTRLTKKQSPRRVQISLHCADCHEDLVIDSVEPSDSAADRRAQQQGERPMTDDEIRKLVRKKLADRTLQRHYTVLAERVGPGLSTPAVETAFSVGSALPHPCVVCGGHPTQLLYECQRVAFHRECHRIWQEEGRKLTSQQRLDWGR